MSDDRENYWMQRAEFHVDEILKHHAGRALSERVLREVMVEAFIVGAQVYEEKISSLIHEKEREIFELNFELSQRKGKK